MTFKCTTKDDKGNPVPGILIMANVQETGVTFQRSSDGNGYSDVALEQGALLGGHVTLSVIKEGFAIWTQYFTVTPEDQEVSITLIPFVG